LTDLNTILPILLPIVLVFVLALVSSLITDYGRFNSTYFFIAFGLGIMVLIWQNVLPFYFYMIPILVIASEIMKTR